MNKLLFNIKCLAEKYQIQFNMNKFFFYILAEKYHNFLLIAVVIFSLKYFKIFSLFFVNFKSNLDT